MIRKATPSDIPYVLELYTKGLNEIGYDNIKESYLLNKVITSYHLAPCFLLEVEDEIVGMAGLTVYIQPWSGEATLNDYIFYMKPEHRNTRNLGGLVDNCKEFAKEKGIPLRVNFIVNNDEDLRKRVLKKHGFEVKSVLGEYNG